jgi:hypothetical protein
MDDHFREPPRGAGERPWHYLLVALIVALVIWGILSSMQPAGESPSPTETEGAGAAP